MSVNKYYFPIKGNKDLGKALWDRAQQLGWIVDGEGKYFDNVCGGSIYLGATHHPDIIFYDVICKETSELLNLYDFFHTDKYRIKPRTISVKLTNGYTAVVQKGGEVTVGCTTFNVEQAQAIINAHKELNKE